MNRQYSISMFELSFVHTFTSLHSLQSLVWMGDHADRTHRQNREKHLFIYNFASIQLQIPTTIITNESKRCD